MRFTRHKKSGFTLVEMIIYIAFFAILSILAIEALMVVTKSFYTLRLTQNINQSATTALERMSREVRNAYDIDTASSTFNTNPGYLVLRTKDASGANTTVEFYVNGNQIGIKEGGVDKGSLMAKSTTVTNLVFRQITTANSKAIKIEMSLHDTHGVLSRDAVFYDTILLRGSTH